MDSSLTALKLMIGGDTKASNANVESSNVQNAPNMPVSELATPQRQKVGLLTGNLLKC